MYALSLKGGLPSFVAMIPPSLPRASARLFFFVKSTMG